LTVSDRSGSVTVLVSEELHFGHSKIRFSAALGRGELRISSIRVWQWPQRGRSIAVSGISVEDILIMANSARTDEAASSISLIPQRRTGGVRAALLQATLRVPKINTCGTRHVCPVADMRELFSRQPSDHASALGDAFEE
jgi:hypothetical protein